jgi:hypothetical protein
VNTLNATISSPFTTVPGYSLTGSNNSSNVTCPFSINYLNEKSEKGCIPTTTANITAGLYLAKISDNLDKCNNENKSDNERNEGIS